MLFGAAHLLDASIGHCRIVDPPIVRKEAEESRGAACKLLREGEGHAPTVACPASRSGPRLRGARRSDKSRGTGWN